MQGQSAFGGADQAPEQQGRALRNAPEMLQMILLSTLLECSLPVLTTPHLLSADALLSALVLSF